MKHCCSQCSFTAHFESALTMHHQLHHENGTVLFPEMLTGDSMMESNTLPRTKKSQNTFDDPGEKVFKLSGRTSSATRLFGKIKSKICKSKTLFSHVEEQEPSSNDLSVRSECTSKAYKADSQLLRQSEFAMLKEPQNESFGCHLCPFEADRITILDRHLLNDHKIGLENLLKLVMAKTKDGLNDDMGNEFFIIKQPYYKTFDGTNDEGEFIIETVSPKIKIVKHSSTNTDNLYPVYENLDDSFKTVSSEFQRVLKCTETASREDLLDKMQSLNDYMCKFVDSSRTLKRVLTKELNSKPNIRGEPIFEVGLGDQDSPRDWDQDRPHSDNMERRQIKDNRSEKGKYSNPESFYLDI